MSTSRIERSNKTRPGMGFKGMVKVDVVDSIGNVVMEGEWKNDLLLDCGLDKMAHTPICDIFKVCVKGGNIDQNADITTPTPTLESVTGTYTLTVDTGNLTGTLTRVTGARDFTAYDIDNLVRTTNVSGSQVECVITGLTSASVVTVKGVGLNTISAYAGKTIQIYSVSQIQLDNEIERTATYSSVSGDNSTDTGKGASAGTRTLTRTFLFGPEPDIPADDIVSPTDSTRRRPGVYTWSGTSLTCVFDAGMLVSQFNTWDVGSYVFLNGKKTKIVAYVSSTHVTLDTSHSGSLVIDTSAGTSTPTDTCEIYSPNYYTEIGFSDLESAPAQEVRAGSGGSAPTVSWVGNTLTATDTTVFSSDDVGRYVLINHAPGLGAPPPILARITAYVDATNVTISRTIPSTGWTGGATLGVIVVYMDNPVNIRIVLPSAVPVYGQNPTDPSQQLKVTYKFIIQAGPTTKTAVNNPIANWAVSGYCVIEEFGTSIVMPNGLTNTDNAGLDPSTSGYIALSPVSTAISNMSANVVVPVRSAGATSIPCTADTYVPGNFANTYTGTFGINDAVTTTNTLWSLMLYNPASGSGYFTFLFAKAKGKDGTHTLSVSFQKSWNRNLG